jgi:hypothetical protein
MTDNLIGKLRPALCTAAIQPVSAGNTDYGPEKL